VAFNKDRLEVVCARDISDAELAAAKSPEYGSLPFTGPRYVSIDVPAAEQQDAMFQSVAGNEEHMRPRFYVPYEQKLEEIRSHAKTLEDLEKLHPDAKPQLEAARAKVTVPPERVRWLPVHHRKGFWTVLIDTGNGMPLAWVDFDPY
jgi:hypothetical protein